MGVWRRSFAAVFATALAVGPRPGAAFSDLSTDPSYVVQLHASRAAVDASALPSGARIQRMTTESGQQFECFLPPAERSDEPNDRLLQSSTAEEGGEHEFLSFSRAAVKKIRPKCVQYVDVTDNWVYEICPGVLVRKVSLKGRLDAEKPVDSSSSAERDSVEAAMSHEVVELGAYLADSSSPVLAFEDFVGTETQDRVRSHEKPLYTQSFAGASEGHDSLRVQFMCNAAERDDTVAAVQWTREAAGKVATGFLVTSRVFCDPKHSDTDDTDLFTVRSLLQPLADATTCVKRNEGWWTYEFCFGQGIRQYHRDSDGRITAEFSLGKFDTSKNDELEASGGALVFEHVDATHDVARPAYLELYGHGTFCKEFDNHAPREAKVFYYCSQGGTSHHILAVKEVQTCSYTLKVSSPVLCDHPHFLNDDAKADAEPEVIHCLPVEDADEQGV